ncbi:hypothetical protein D8B26_003303 [Coccidioides posadasii str. Silveira]|uniref:CP2 transcription factor family protein n=2 Tax=Coccidioides posadasii TaxID=199306 RepID=C5P9C2_COCP7|nr:CP2 transcription factor family protein [Coccidioides posadasii C735 delta SOWgp]EER26334.1 CP2 transcription factor family protein [Coccidioides posadasii C735 delta SOWgp]QVM08620.1 hypothetical protein D8B26_003303 [Coccidioides posadasii str. Silveira]|eukprot:XP_003068479.1 CP2 transcription factor family protein [Coccidioides posadasii C735 delta SOWgp]
MMDVKDKKDTDGISKVPPEQWNFTPSLMDPNSFAFSSFANQPPAYYAASPTAGALANPAHSGDMPTPNMALSLLTPLPIPQSSSADPSMPHSAIDLGSFHQPFIPHQGHGVDPFGQTHGFAPSTFLRRDPDLSALGRSLEDPTFSNSLGLNNPSLGLVPGRLSESADGLQGHNNENFRFHATLRASTAMVKDPDEIPVTYLNKGQAYTINIIDTAPMASASQQLRYRTYIRVSFEEEEQRSKPASCWQLWKEGRGTNEAHQRDGKLLAVEHVDPNQGGAGDGRHPRVQLEKANFDGFSVLWVPSRTTGNPECAISVRFNFLSTDFSHSKGVKGIPVRLCAKTEVIATSSSEPPLGDSPEVCYCKVKLFRDHGAERKLSNDVAHIKKLMEKIKQQITQAEIGSANFDKRKRSCSISSKGMVKSAKLGKSKRPWSIGSQDGVKSTLEEDLQIKLSNLNDMFSSTQPVSVLNLKGDPQDDPDLFPVQLDTTLDENFVQRMSFDSAQSNDGASATNAFSPSPGNHSPSSSHHSFEAKGANFMNESYSTSRHGSLDWSSASQRGGDNMKHGQFINQPIKVQRISADDSNPGSDTWIEAMGVDSNYEPPNDTPKKPKCCFYVRARQSMGQKGEDYYHAIYLAERTAKGLMETVAKKCRFDPARIVRALVIRGNGFNVVLDDDVVREMAEGQDMTVEFSELEDSGQSGMDLDDPKSPVTVSDIEMRFFL